MSARRIHLLAAAAVLALPWTSAHAGVRIGIGIGFPICGPCYYPGYVVPAPVYYAPYPYYVTPAPIQAGPPAVPAPPAPSNAPPAEEPAPPPRPVSVGTPSRSPGEPPLLTQAVARPTEDETSRYVGMLSDPDENVRLAAVTRLGRTRARRAVDPLSATLAGDRSHAVREAAARALGLIGDPRAMPALRRASTDDGDRDVRHTAQFAMEILQSR